MIFKFLRTSKFSKVLASYMAIQLLLHLVQPMSIYALTEGATQPEFTKFTPIGTSDMVDLSSGNLNYNIPIMDVGGYPINLSYDAGITMDQEASWVGLGWNLNIGEISRRVRGLPDDFKGDEMIYENKMRKNKTLATSINFHGAISGYDFANIGLDGSMGVTYNNYEGFSYTATSGVSFDLARNVSLGMDLSSSTTEGVTVSPTVGLSNMYDSYRNKNCTWGSIGLGTTFNSRSGISALNVNAYVSNESYVTSKSYTGEVTRGLGVGVAKTFAVPSYTPTRRSKMVNTNYAVNPALGWETFFFEGQLECYVGVSEQKLDDSEKRKTERAFGYDNTEFAGKYDILDFNRENDGLVSKKTKVLPVTNYTYDMYSINAQGAGGAFQSYHSQVGYVFDKYVKDHSIDANLGVEVGVGNAFHFGAEVVATPSTTVSGIWRDNNDMLGHHLLPDEDFDYNYPLKERIYFKNIGSLSVDKEHSDLFADKLGGDEAIRINLSGSDLNKGTNASRYYKGNGSVPVAASNLGNEPLSKKERLPRTNAIEFYTKEEVNAHQINYNAANLPYISSYAKSHHYAESRVLQPDGSVYVFGQPVYNTKKVEATFNVSGRDIEYNNEVVTYSPGVDNSKNNFLGTDNYFNRVTTPAYVHSYLITQVLSEDYKDLTNNGPTEDDLGAYVKFTYNDPYNYKWRMPFKANEAMYNEGFRSLKKDDMGNYVYGEKELTYIKKIETKTHVAIFDLEDRKDSWGVKGENGGMMIPNGVEPDNNSVPMKSIARIRLYAKPEYDAGNDNGILDDMENYDTSIIKPIVTAHFEYENTLCKRIDNFYDPNYQEGDPDGKLTLKKLYFTYKDSKLGQYTPYEFDYHEDNEYENPDYHLKAYNFWGNYKPVASASGYDFDDEPTNAEFPYINQGDANEDIYVGAWSLKEVTLPSGGHINFTYESDDYLNVQNKDAMQMYMVRGASNNNSDIGGDTLFGKRYLTVELPNEEGSNITVADITEKYITPVEDEPIFFRFLLQMLNGQDSRYDYVEGYLKIDKSRAVGKQESNGKVYAIIPIQLVHLNKLENDDNGVNPISKAGWYFGRKYMNRLVYTGEETSQDFDVLEMVENAANQIGAIVSLFEGPNRELKNKNCANKFSITKSFIRLPYVGEGKKGGGLRIAKVELTDNWDKMTGNTGNALYKRTYGQVYEYTNEDGTSSGVATYEPMGGKENPFIEPFEKEQTHRLLAPEESNYIEKPFGASFFPSPTVTYSRVKVRSLHAEHLTEPSLVNSKTGYSVSEFYTSKDFPTITENTVLDGPNDVDLPPGGVSIMTSLFNLNFYVTKKISMSQGFVVITNDMNGKPKSEEIFGEDAAAPISKVEYEYNVTDGKIDNVVTTIDEDGHVAQNTIGVDYNVVNDFRTFKSTLSTFGADYNGAGSVFGIFFLFMPNVRAQFATHLHELKMAVTTKVIHKSTFVVEKRAYDKGARVTTNNLAWDANTGNVLLTKVNNEYNDIIYNLTYPAYWKYKEMGLATDNLGFEVLLYSGGSNNYYSTALSSNNIGLSDIFSTGDEVWIKGLNERAWVVDVDENNMKLIDKDGLYISASSIDVKVIKSGKHNRLGDSMFSITLMSNPLENGDITAQTFDTNYSTFNDLKIINAGVVKYDDLWGAACECDFPELQYTYDNAGNKQPYFVYNQESSYNPYLYNIKGNYRAAESYSYLTSRSSPTVAPVNGSNSGFLTTFKPFYTPGNNGWDTNVDGWTTASTVTQFTPFGNEVENKDALGIYSAALYGYKNKLAIAVAANTEYGELAYDGLEDYDRTNENAAHFQIRSNFITTNEAHTGKRSLLVEARQDTVQINRTVEAGCFTDSSNKDTFSNLITLIFDELHNLSQQQDLIDQSNTSTGATINISAYSSYIYQPTSNTGNLGIYHINIDNLNNKVWFDFYPDGQANSGPEFADIYMDFISSSTILSRLDLPAAYHSQDTNGYNFYTAFSDGSESISKITYFIFIPAFDDGTGKGCSLCTGFSPQKDEKYVISAWVKEVDGASNPVTLSEKLLAQKLTYENSKIKLRFYDPEGEEYDTNLAIEFFPSGDIIDGWQKITGVFTVPISASQINFEFTNITNTEDIDVYFDDIRVHPFNGSMKSYVYDDDSYRLMAELDDNNYATFYEYDKEGGLIRVKKETERGIMTIKEGRSGNYIE